MRPRNWLFVAALVGTLGGAAVAKEDLGDLVNGMNGSAESAARIAYVRRIALSGSERGAQVLCKTAQNDADPAVRVEAAKALVVMDTHVAYPSLKELLTEGGIREVRRQAAIGMAARPQGLEWTLTRIRSGRTDKVERVLLVSALGDFPGLDSAAALEEIVGVDEAPVAGRPPVRSGTLQLARFVGREHPPLRSVAIRALARHPLGSAELPRIAVEVLTHAEDPETILATLDVCDGVLDREIRGVLPALLGRGDPRITAAAQIVSKRLDWMDAVDRFNQQKKADDKARSEGYAPQNPTAASPPPPPTVPSVRPKVDVVYVCDASASMGFGKVRNVNGIAPAAAEELDPNVSYRHGFVSMQDTMREAWDPPSMYFPPLFDVSVLKEVRWRQPSMGVDTEGMEVGVVLRALLDKFDWRPGAERRVVVGSDTYVGDLALAKRTVRVHHEADGLSLAPPFFGFGTRRNLRTWDELLAAAGGTPPDRKK